MKRVLLTGIGGSIAYHTAVHFFKNTDWHIVGIDSWKHKGWIDRVTELVKEYPEYKERLTVITHDLVAPFSDVTKKKIGKIDYIISMASLSDVEASIHYPIEVINNNVSIVVNLLEYAREIKPEVFLQISTDEVYGASKKEQQHKEWSPIIPSNPYSASKACQEAIAISYWRTYNVPVVITNTMNNFGEMQQDSKYPVMVQKWIEEGETVKVHGVEGEIGTRYYMHSLNHADAVMYIIKNLKPHIHEAGAIDMPDRYNIVGDVQKDNLELAQDIARMMGKELKFEYEMVDWHSTRPGHDLHYGLDGTKLEKLGWEYPYPYEQSMKDTIDWQSKHKEWL